VCQGPKTLTELMMVVSDSSINMVRRLMPTLVAGSGFRTRYSATGSDAHVGRCTAGDWIWSWT